MPALSVTATDPKTTFPLNLLVEWMGRTFVPPLRLHYFRHPTYILIWHEEAQRRRRFHMIKRWIIDNRLFFFFLITLSL